MTSQTPKPWNADHPYAKAVGAWQTVFKGDPGHQPLKEAFGVDVNDWADSCSICGHGESLYEHNYDTGQTRMIPTGFPEAKQMPHERICPPCAIDRFPETRKISAIVRIALRLPRYLLEAVDRAVGEETDISREAWIRQAIRLSLESRQHHQGRESGRDNQPTRA